MDKSKNVSAIGYIRVSTSDQSEKGISLEAQKEKILAYCDLYGYDLKSIIEDAGKSAKNLQRPGIQTIIKMINQKAIDTVVCFKLDRLTRSVRDLADILDMANSKDVSLVSVSEKLDTGTASGRLVINIMATVSQWEREAIGERTKIAMAYKKTQGDCVGEIPYGYDRIGGKLQRNASEQATIATIRGFRDTEGNTYRQIAKELNDRGIKSKKGGKWYPMQVKRVLNL